MPKQLSELTRAELLQRRNEIYSELGRLEDLIGFNHSMLQKVDALLAGHNVIAAIFGNCRCEPCLMERKWDSERLA